MKQLLVSIFALFFIFSAMTSYAAGPGPYYAGVFGGYVIPDKMKLENGSESRDVSFKNSWALGAKVGYILPSWKYLALEAEYFYLAKQDVDEAGASGNYSANNLMFNALLRYPEGNIHPFLGAGIGCSWAAVSDLNAPVDATGNGFAWQILAGVNFDIAPNWSADVAYRYFSSKYGIEGVDITAKNNLLLLGINYHF